MIDQRQAMIDRSRLNTFEFLELGGDDRRFR